MQRSVTVEKGVLELRRGVIGREQVWLSMLRATPQMKKAKKYRLHLATVIYVTTLQEDLRKLQIMKDAVDKEVGCLQKEVQQLKSNVEEFAIREDSF